MQPRHIFALVSNLASIEYTCAHMHQSHICKRRPEKRAPRCPYHRIHQHAHHHVHHRVRLSMTEPLPHTLPSPPAHLSFYTSTTPLILPHAHLAVSMSSPRTLSHAMHAQSAAHIHTPIVFRSYTPPHVATVQTAIRRGAAQTQTGAACPETATPHNLLTQPSCHDREIGMECGNEFHISYTPPCSEHMCCTAIARGHA